jgi:RNA polymerase sigma-70 factor (ECF subfamily)
MNRNSSEFEALVAEAQAGSLEAFEVLYRRLQPGIYAFVRGQVREAELAADLAQQTFVRAWESLPRLRKAGAFVGWIHRIAVNLVRDEAKSGRARLEVAASALAEGDPALTRAAVADPQPEQALASAELRQAVRAALAALPAEHQAVVVMHHFEGMSVAEIAGVLKVRPGTVMSRLARAREAMRRHLSPFVEGSDE